MRLIDADALEPNADYDDGEFWAYSIEQVHSASTIEPEQRWIPCSEKLPEDDEVVLVSDGIDYAVAFWRSDAEAWDDPLHGWLDSFEFDVKAWMPLPEPYREEGEKHEGSD